MGDTLTGRVRTNRTAKRLRRQLHQFEAGGVSLTDVIDTLDVLLRQHKRHSEQCQRAGQQPPTHPLDRLTEAHRKRLAKVRTIAYMTRIPGYENYY